MISGVTIFSDAFAQHQHSHTPSPSDTRVAVEYPPAMKEQCLSNGRNKDMAATSSPSRFRPGPPSETEKTPAFALP